METISPHHAWLTRTVETRAFAHDWSLVPADWQAISVQKTRKSLLVHFPRHTARNRILIRTMRAAMTYEHLLSLIDHLEDL